jgi:hypothetical protein
MWEEEHWQLTARKEKIIVMARQPVAVQTRVVEIRWPSGAEAPYGERWRGPGERRAARVAAVLGRGK